MGVVGLWHSVARVHHGCACARLCRGLRFACRACARCRQWFTSSAGAVKRTRSSSPDRYLVWKVAIFFLAAGMWLAGVISGRSWLSGAAIVVLLVAIVLRFLPQGADEDAAES